MAKKTELKYKEKKKKQYFITQKDFFKNGGKYLDIRRVIKFFPKASLYVIYGARGVGKTETARRFLRNTYKKQLWEIKNKVWSYEDYINRKIVVDKKFVWLNRTGKEITSKKNSLFREEGWISYGASNEIQVIVPIKYINIDGQEDKTEVAVTLGKYEALNNSSKIRGGDSFNGYSYVIWDEFMDEKDGYVSNEWNAFMSILHTTMRSKKADNTKLFLFSNAVDKDCQLFTEMDFDPRVLEKGQQAYYPQQGRVFCYVEGNDEFQKMYQESMLIKVFGDTQYMDYAVKSEFAFNDDTFIESQPEPGYSMKFQFHVKIMNNYFSVYEYKKGLYVRNNVIMSKDGEFAGKLYPLSKEDALGDGIAWTGQGKKLANWFYYHAIHKTLLFENKQIRQIMLQYIKMEYPNFK